MKIQKSRAFAFMGPSGVGKGKVGGWFMNTAWAKKNCRRIPSHHERDPRPDDPEDQFIQETSEWFDAIQKTDLWVTFTGVAGKRYAFLRQDILDAIADGFIPVFDMRTQTLMSLSQKMPELDIQAFLIRPTKIETILARLIKRDGDTPNAHERYATAAGEFAYAHKLKQQGIYPFETIINDDEKLDEATASLVSYIPELARVAA